MDDEVSVVFLWVGAGWFAGFTALIIGLELSGVIAALFNPEYWALKQILK